MTFETHGLFYMKRSVHTTHVGPWLHRHWLSRINSHAYTHTRARAHVSRRYTQTHTYTGWSESGVGSLDASHSINTPRCLLRLNPQERRCTPSMPSSPLSLLFLSFSISLVRLFYPPAAPSLHRGGRVHPLPRKGTIRWKRAFGRPKTRGRKYFAQQNFSTHTRRCKNNKKIKKSGHSLTSFSERKMATKFRLSILEKN